LNRLAEKCGAAKRARKFKCWAHYITMIFSQISGAESLRDYGRGHCRAWLQVLRASA
jgi:hypothetical protein